MHRHPVERAMAGDRDAFTELARGSIGRHHAIARLILRDVEKAEAATQEALVAAWRQFSALREPDPRASPAPEIVSPRGRSEHEVLPAETVVGEASEVVVACHPDRTLQRSPALCVACSPRASPLPRRIGTKAPPGRGGATSVR